MSPLLLLLSQSSSQTFLSHLADAWVYVSLGASGIITEEVAPLLGGFAAHQGHLGMKRVMLACAVGTWSATTALYALGRWRAPWVRRTWHRADGYMQRALGAVSRRPWQSALAVRFAFGARLVLPVACGAAHVPVSIYLLGTAISSIVWSALFVLIGWGFGESTMLLVGQIRRYEDEIAAGIILVVAALFAFFTWRRQRRERETLPGD